MDSEAAAPPSESTSVVNTLQDMSASEGTVAEHRAPALEHDDTGSETEIMVAAKHPANHASCTGDLHVAQGDTLGSLGILRAAHCWARLMAAACLPVRRLC